MIQYLIDQKFGTGHEVITTDYKIIISRTFKVKNSHLKLARFVLFPVGIVNYAVGEKAKT